VELTEGRKAGVMSSDSEREKHVEGPGGPGVTRRKLLANAAAVGAGLAVGGTGSAAARSVRRLGPTTKGKGSVVVYDGGGAWGDAERRAYREPFQRETGIKVIPNPGPANPNQILAGIKAGVPGYDVIHISGCDLSDWLRRGNLLVPLDFRYMDPKDRANMAPVPANKYAVPDLYYSIVIAWDTTKISGRTPKGWRDFWDTTAFPGPRAAQPGDFGASSGIWEAALLADGVPPSKLYPLNFTRALASLDKIKGSIVKYVQSGAEPVQLLQSHEVVLTMAGNARITDARARGIKAAFTWNQGLLLYDLWAVPRGAKNVDNAMRFIAFASRPKPQANFAKFIPYSPANQRAFAHLTRKQASLLPTYPAWRKRQVLQNCDFWSRKLASGQTQSEHAINLWTKWIAG